MVGSTKTTVGHHHHRRRNLMDDDDRSLDLNRRHDEGRDGAEDENESPSSGVSCSICLDLVSDNGVRSRAKLQCGHEFHLDCIGSAFNMKGAMQCPNCRKIEKGQWLYANGNSRPLLDLNADDWIPDEDFYDISYSEMPYGVHWCPFGELPRVGSFEEAESPSTTYADMRGHHSVYAEHPTASSMAHSYVAYLGPIPPGSSRSNDGIEDPNFNHHWNGLPGHGESFNRHTFPAINIQYQGWGRHSPPFSISSSHINGADPASVPPMTLRSSTGELDTRARSTAFPHPALFGSGSTPAATTGSFFSSIMPRHPGSSARASERIHASHLFRHRQQSGNSQGMPTPIIHGNRRFDGPPMGLPMPQHDHNGGFFIIPPSSSGQNSHEAETPSLNHFHTWEREQIAPYQHPSFDRDSGWGSYPQNAGSSDSSNRPSSFWRRHSS